MDSACRSYKLGRPCDTVLVKTPQGSRSRCHHSHAFGLLSDALMAAGIPIVKSDSAMFCWVDMRQALVARRERSMAAAAYGTPGPAAAAASGPASWPEGTGARGGSLDDADRWEEERALWKDLVYKYGVLVTPGEAVMDSLLGSICQCQNNCQD